MEVFSQIDNFFRTMFPGFEGNFEAFYILCDLYFVCFMSCFILECMTFWRPKK